MAETTIVPAWTWAIPLIAAGAAFAGGMLSTYFQRRGQKHLVKSAHTLKIAEMRQAWINNLRDAMAKFQSFGITPGVDQITSREFYEFGTRIELFMNPNDPDYPELQKRMYRYSDAREMEEKFSANAAYIEICQRILKREWEVLKKDVKDAI